MCTNAFQRSKSVLSQVHQAESRSVPVIHVFELVDVGECIEGRLPVHYRVSTIASFVVAVALDH
jgi:hypothetical protein